MNREEFIKAQVSFQFGACAAEPGIDLAQLALREADERPSLVFHDPSSGSFVPEQRGEGLSRNGSEGWRADLDGFTTHGMKLKALRKADLLSDLYQAGLDAPVLIDMNDAVWEPNAFPIFQYNRMAGAPNAILWPHRRVHNLGRRPFCKLPDEAESKREEKTPRLLWRGSLRGFSTHRKGPRNVIGIVKTHLAGRMGKEQFLAHLNTVPRYAFVSRYADVEGFDVGFSQAPKEMQRLREVPELARLEKPRVAAAEQLANRYMISISGTDVATSFGWQTGTNCVVLKESYPWQVYFDGHFAPWEHFVPVQTDFADVPEKIAWSESHPEACDAMAAKRHALIPLLIDKAARSEALRRVVARYNDFYARWRAGRS